MKKFLISVAIASFVFSSLNAEDLLTGDTKLACEAILCLSSSEKPSECEPSLHRYFSIHYKKWSKTLNARKSFLKLCPVGEDGEKDKEFRNLRDNILVQIQDPCDINSLNSRLEKTFKADDGGLNKLFSFKIRINPNLPQSCKLLMSSKYTNIKPKYVCSGEFYNFNEWNGGYKLTKVDKATFELQKARDPQLAEIKTQIFYVGDRMREQKTTTYFVKEKINKNCWIMQ